MNIVMVLTQTPLFSRVTSFQKLRPDSKKAVNLI